MDGMDRLPKLAELIASKRASIAQEIERVSAQWQALGRMGAQRSDHAAALLANVRPLVAELAEFCAAVCQQIENAD
jgi:hypothetical protein